jgi:hypothetical protein
MDRNELLESFHEVEALDTNQFLKVKETLTRIGLPGKKGPDGRPVLWQSCHILHKKGRYYICHFKQLFQLDGRTNVTDFTDEDEDRLDYIVSLLEEWDLVKPMCETYKPDVNVLVIPFADKGKWTLKQKYSVGTKKNQTEQ